MTILQVQKARRSLRVTSRSLSNPISTGRVWSCARWTNMSSRRAFSAPGTSAMATVNKCVEWQLVEHGWHLALVYEDGVPHLPTAASAMSFMCQMAKGKGVEGFEGVDKCE